MGTRQLTLVCRQLFGRGGARPSLASLPKLQQLVNRGKSLPLDLPAGYDAIIFDHFGIRASEGEDLPVAAVTRMLDIGVVDKGWWLRADPVHLLAGRSGLMLAASNELEITDDEAASLVQEILQVFNEDGWILKAPNPHRWYLKPVKPPRITTTPLDVAKGQDIEACLPTGPDGRAWHTVLNEIQILLHTAAVNVERDRNDIPTINSVWFWGGGSLPSVGETDWQGCWGDDLLSQALARIGGVPSHTPPANAGDWLDKAGPGRHLMVLNGESHRYDDMDFDRDWVEPLTRALRKDELSELTLYVHADRAVRLTSRDLSSWWMLRMPFTGG